MKRGFTLVELVVAIGIFAIVLAITFTFFTSMLSQANKINITTELKQNGQIVVALLERQIRNSIDARNPTADNKVLELVNQQGQIVRFRCVDEASSQNGYIERNTLPITNKDDLVNGISLASCLLQVENGLLSTSPKIVNIDLTFHQAVNAPSRADFIAEANFKDTISLRNYR